MNAPRNNDVTARGEVAMADDDDRSRFIQFIHDDSNVISLCLDRSRFKAPFDDRAMQRLGVILAQNTCLEKLRLFGFSNIAVAAFNIGLQHNKHIQEIDFTALGLSDPGNMHALAPFLTNNPSLRMIGLRCCNIGPAGCNILSDALEARPLDTLKTLDLEGNNLGDIAIDRLIQVLRKSREMEILCLGGNGIGQGGCASIATMLMDPVSNLRCLWMNGNSLTDESVVTLAHSLAENTRLAFLFLNGNTQITGVGWTAVEDLVCNTASMANVVKSNHTLEDVCDGWHHQQGLEVKRAMGAQLFASLGLNRNSNKIMVVRQKIIWGHAEGDFNLADSTIGTTTLPRILSWFTDESSPNTILLQHQETARLDAIYRIVQSRPDLCPARQSEDSKLRKLDPWIVAVMVSIVSLVFQIVMQHWLNEDA